MRGRRPRRTRHHCALSDGCQADGLAGRYNQTLWIRDVTKAVVSSIGRCNARDDHTEEGSWNAFVVQTHINSGEDRSLDTVDAWGVAQ